MKRIINFRPMFYGFLALAISIAFAKFIFALNWIYIGIVLFAFLALVTISYFRKQWKNFIFILFAFIFGFGLYSIDINNFKATTYNGEYKTVFARVSDDVWVNEIYYTTIHLENVQINGKYEKDILLNLMGNYEYSNISTGDYVLFNANIYNIKPFENGIFNSFEYKLGTSYCAEVDISDITVQSGDLSLSEKLKKYVFDIYNNVMDAETAGLAYSVIFGDKTYLDEDIQNGFSISGIAHLLAVSGLHIGFLTTILFFLLKRFKVEGWLRFIIIASILCLYAYLCNFSPSVVRATIMCLVFLATTLFGRQTDLLSSIGTAGIIILLISPLYVFDVGFQMSFASVIGIALFYKSISKFYNKKFRFPKKVSDATAIDLCTTIAIIPPLAVVSNNISFLSPIANLICIPIFAFAYMCLFCITFVVALLPFLQILLQIPNVLLNLITDIAMFISSIDWSIISLVALKIAGVVLFYFAFFMCSRFCFASHYKKFIAVCLTAIVTCSVTFVFSQPYKATECTYTQLNTYGASAIITSNKGETFLFCGRATNSELTYIENYCGFKNICNINTIFLNDIPNGLSDAFVQKYKVKNVICDSYENLLIGEFSLQVCYLNNIKKILVVSVNNLDIIYRLDFIGTNQAQQLAGFVNGLDIEVIVGNHVNFSNICEYDKYLSISKVYGVENNISTKTLGSFTFSFENDKIGKIRSVD